MTASGRLAPVTPVPAELAAPLAADLRLLCRLHDREVDAALIADLRSRPARDWFGLALSDAAATTGFGLLDRALADMPEPVDTQTLDALAADFADIYLTFGARVAPNESYWRTEDHLERQDPMFAVRAWYAHYGLAAQDWRKRADDHLIHEMEFVAALLEQNAPHAHRDAARFLDRHLLAWAPAFFAGVAAHAMTQFYAGLALVTLGHLQATRDLLELMTGEPRTVVSMVPDAKCGGPAQQVTSFMPGTGPGW